MHATVIFLDIDGVLATHKQFATKKSSPYYLHEYDAYPFDEKCVNILNDILRITDAEIILSSDWSIHYTLEEMNGIFRHNGIIKSPYDYVQQKEIEVLEVSSLKRGFAIDQYLRKHRDEFGSYAIVDDLDIRAYEDWCNFKKLDKAIDYSNFVHCVKGTYEGIKQIGIKEKILRILNQPIIT